MPYGIETTNDGLTLELSGEVTVRHAGDLARSLSEALTSGAHVLVRTGDLTDVDTCILQLLVSLRKTAASFVLPDPSEVFVRLVDRCALRRELLTGSRETS